MKALPGIRRSSEAQEKINRDKLAEAAVFLRSHLLHPESTDTIAMRDLMVDKGASWNIKAHFTGGMSTRNFLRTNGFGEKELGVKNLDDVYAPLVEFVVLCTFAARTSDADFNMLSHTLLYNTICRVIAGSEHFYELQEHECSPQTDTMR